MALLVRLHGGLERNSAAPTYTDFDLPAGATLLDVQDALGIPRGEVGLFIVDGELRNDGFVPPPNATIDIYPLFGGG